jgi:hypothetical protein
VSYTAETGRVGVHIADVGKLAVRPEHVELEADDPGGAARGAFNPREVSWTSFLRQIGLGRLRHVIWASFESELFERVGRGLNEPEARDDMLRLLQRAGVHNAAEREKLAAALGEPLPAWANPRLSAIGQLVARRMGQEDRQAEEAASRAAEEASVPTVSAEDARYVVSSGRVCRQKHGEVAPTGVASPPPPAGAVYPSLGEAGPLAQLLRTRAKLAVCLNECDKARLLEGLLELCGVRVMAVAYDPFQDEKMYAEERIYCREVRRIGVHALPRLLHPRETALVFTCCWLVPWRAFLARYPEVPLVVIIGSADHPLGQKPMAALPSDLEDDPNWTKVHTSPVNVHQERSLTCEVYSRVYG